MGKHRSPGSRKTSKRVSYLPLEVFSLQRTSIETSHATRISSTNKTQSPLVFSYGNFLPLTSTESYSQRQHCSINSTAAKAINHRSESMPEAVSLKSNLRRHASTYSDSCDMALVSLKRNTASNKSIGRRHSNDDSISRIHLSNSGDEDSSNDGDLVVRTAKKVKSVSFSENEVSGTMYFEPWIRKKYMTVHKVDSALAAAVWHLENANDLPNFEELVADAGNIIETASQRCGGKVNEASQLALNTPPYSNVTAERWEPPQFDLPTEADELEDIIAEENFKAEEKARSSSNKSLSLDTESPDEDEKPSYSDTPDSRESESQDPKQPTSEQELDSVPSSAQWKPEVDLPDEDEELEQIIEEENARLYDHINENPDYTIEEIARANRKLFHNSPAMRRVTDGFGHLDPTWSRPAALFYNTRPMLPSLLRNVENPGDETAPSTSSQEWTALTEQDAILAEQSVEDFEATPPRAAIQDRRDSMSDFDPMSWADQMIMLDCAGNDDEEYYDAEMNYGEDNEEQNEENDDSMEPCTSQETLTTPIRIQECIQQGSTHYSPLLDIIPATTNSEQVDHFPHAIQGPDAQITPEVEYIVPGAYIHTTDDADINTFELLIWLLTLLWGAVTWLRELRWFATAAAAPAAPPFSSTPAPSTSRAFTHAPAALNTRVNHPLTTKRTHPPLELAELANAAFEPTDCGEEWNPQSKKAVGVKVEAVVHVIPWMDVTVYGYEYSAKGRCGQGNG